MALSTSFRWKMPITLEIRYFNDFSRCALILYLIVQAASIFTGEEELFAYDRTVSRLSEMQTQEYWKMWESMTN